MNGTSVPAAARLPGGLFRIVRKRDVSPEAPMDGFTAFLNSPPGKRVAATHQAQPFMDHAGSRLHKPRP